jgi:hypothetical protein
MGGMSIGESGDVATLTTRISADAASGKSASPPAARLASGAPSVATRILTAPPSGLCQMRRMGGRLKRGKNAGVTAAYRA